MVLNDVSSSFYDEIFRFVSDKLGPDIAAASYETFPKINLSGINSKLNEFFPEQDIIDISQLGGLSLSNSDQFDLPLAESLLTLLLTADESKKYPSTSKG
jgi:hypothetical protein